MVLHCRGVVQGVGFRPMVHRLASELALVGEVENVAGAVRLDLQGERRQLQRLVRRLPAALQPPGALEPLEPRWLPPRHPAPRGLRIAAAAARPLGPGLIAPALAADLAPCSACLAELRDPANRRHRYPFISCCSCGPRYSIATAEPYARAHTTMAGFALCAACQREFDDPADRRFHAETICCPTCGPRLQWLGVTAGGGAAAASAEPLSAAVALLRSGGILALQGVGGFQLLVDARNPAALARLRRRKRRPHKPLALLVADSAWLEPWLQISASERRLLQGPEAPIVLLQRRPAGPGPQDGLPASLAPGSDELGVMLPASPLHQLLVTDFGGPLVATSGNASGEPLCIGVAEALARLADPRAPIADGVVIHGRAIARRLDDSVLRCIDDRPQLLRRARGYAPAALPLPAAAAAGAVLALGGDLKSAPALAIGARAWLAPHLGDLAEGRHHDHWQGGMDALLQRHGGQLHTLCSDRHPGYISQQWAHRSCAAWPGLQHLAVQHHQAHGLAVLAEHGRLPPALVLAFDGLGYGEGAVPLWGGEGLELAGDGRCRRLLSLRPFPLPGAARAMAEPRRAALGLLAACGAAALEHPGAAATLEAFSPAERRLLLQALAAGCQSPLSSSVGRLVDAVASLLDLVQVQSFEGQGGLLLQGAAAAAPAALQDPYPLPVVRAPAAAGVAQWLDWSPLLQALLADRAAGVEPARCAARVLAALAQAPFAWASGQRRLPVVLAGGCFQNRLLLQGAIESLRRAGLEPLWGQRVPCNDGGLALGQLLAAALNCVSSAAAADPARPSA
jgi:hydrogenase maturation protein HypF